MNLWQQPILDIGPEAQKRRERALWQMIMQQGRDSFAGGIGYEACPPYRDKAMADSWRFGWRSEQRKKRKPQ